MEQFLRQNLVWITLLVVWTLPWKGTALWRSAWQKEKHWFIIFLFANTLAVLEILYIFIFSKNKKMEN